RSSSILASSPRERADERSPDRADSGGGRGVGGAARVARPPVTGGHAGTGHARVEREGPARAPGVLVGRDGVRAGAYPPRDVRAAEARRRRPERPVLRGDEG